MRDATDAVFMAEDEESVRIGIGEGMVLLVRPAPRRAPDSSTTTRRQQDAGRLTGQPPSRGPPVLPPPQHKWPARAPACLPACSSPAPSMINNSPSSSANKSACWNMIRMSCFLSTSVRHHACFSIKNREAPSSSAPHGAVQSRRPWDGNGRGVAVEYFSCRPVINDHAGWLLLPGRMDA